MQLSLVSLLVLGFLFVSCDAFASNEVEALIRFKEAMYKDPLLILSNWNVPNLSPCDWNGIICSPTKDYVIKIIISNTSLRGFLVPEIGQMTYLQELILSGNILMGTIPKEIGKLKRLKILDLGNNHLTGEIPAEIGRLSSIRTLNLQSNGLIGTLPPEIGNLKYLKELIIDRNRLVGSIPIAANTSKIGLCESSLPKVADFSYNFFVGSIPSCLDYLPRTSFQGNCMQIKDVKQRPFSQCAAIVAKKKHPIWLRNFEIVTGSSVGLLFLVVLFSAFSLCNVKRSLIVPWKKSASEKEKFTTVYVDSEMLKDVLRFTRQELEVACEDFSNIIDSCADSQIYKGTIKSETEIAVISLCVKEEDWTGYLELNFQREVADLARLNHENAGKLLGYCKESTPFTRMLVFEYASNGTLYDHLHYGEGSLVSWAKRMKIVIGIARGLKYLHTELNPPFTVSELSSTAVYLTEEFTPKLVDFKSWKSIQVRSEKNLRNISCEGAICVLPNAIEHRDLDLQGNIYSFGILLVEIVSGRPSYCQERGCLVEWAREKYLSAPDVITSLVDPELKHFNQKELEAVCEVANQCLNLDQSEKDKDKPPCSIQTLCDTLESRITVSISAEFKSSSLAWAELALGSPSNDDQDERSK
ncbi:PREDICTED: probable LRR receptor-like serine/threonine-protein kinase At1g63430 [Camelina sativa]|uniref:Probable LRR receptor-like serine/threonine-protein kinase At1g63430 n=1 Tax=Camelina sativa TaxID=90675 RepID=A0ABM0UW38_CAMSA|nr:PREDICTED: probable LRR receptor-like serine/threonine-protein kinase At1g63430 [Camelina sativa]